MHQEESRRKIEYDPFELKLSIEKIEGGSTRGRNSVAPIVVHDVLLLVSGTKQKLSDLCFSSSDSEAGKDHSLRRTSR
jgi:hypothetical protein